MEILLQQHNTNISNKTKAKFKQTKNNNFLKAWDKVQQAKTTAITRNPHSHTHRSSQSNKHIATHNSTSSHPTHTHLFSLTAFICPNYMWNAVAVQNVNGNRHKREAQKVSSMRSGPESAARF